MRFDHSLYYFVKFLNHFEILSFSCFVDSFSSLEEYYSLHYSLFIITSSMKCDHGPTCAQV